MSFLALIGRITFKDAYLHYFDEGVLARYLDNSFNVKTLRYHLADPNTRFWLAWVDQLPVAYAKVNLYYPREKGSAMQQARLERLYVLRDFLGLGIGGQLLTAAVRELQQLSFTSLWLLAHQDNEQAIRFYERHGFAETAREEHAYGEQYFPLVCMEKTVDDFSGTIKAIKEIPKIKV